MWWAMQEGIVKKVWEDGGKEKWWGGLNGEVDEENQMWEVETWDYTGS